MKIGDKVKLTKQLIRDDFTLEGMESDLLACIAEGDITGRAFDALRRAMEKAVSELEGDKTANQEFILYAIEENGYAIKLSKNAGGHKYPFLFAESHLKPA